MWIRKNKTYVLKTAAEFSNLSRIRDYVLKFAKKSGLTRKQLNDCKLAVDEAVTNVMRHGYSGSEQGDIQIEVIRFEARFEVIIKDWGREFDWASVIDPDLNKYVQIRRKGGLGVWLIKKLTNTVSHHRINNENILTMGFNIDLAARKALIHELWSNIRDRMNISFKFTLFGSLMIFLILGGIYIYIRYNQSGRARISFISKGKNAALNIANNGVNFILDNQNDIALSELVSNVRKSVDIISYITIINTRNLIIADTDTRRLFTRYNLPKGLKKLKNKKIPNNIRKKINGT
ncbi:MAG: ATP-binding protein [Spirochaetes bacterium]|nr:ATP-binding protein [Spirochaetota bacterium]